METGVVASLIAPARPKIVVLRRVTLVKTNIDAARNGLMVDQSYGRLAQRPPPPFRQPEAEIDVIEVDGQIGFIEAADSQELCAFHRQAGCGHRADFVRRPQPVEKKPGSAAVRPR
jgi:hypothetical protein